MKSLIDFTREKYADPSMDYVLCSDVGEYFADIISAGETEMTMNDAEYRAFLLAYDNILPHNWDEIMRFRGIKITRIK